MHLVATNLHIKPDVGSGAAMASLAVSTSVVTLDQTKWTTNTKYVLVQFRGNTVRVTFNGGDPTTDPYITFTAGTIAEWSRATAAGAVDRPALFPAEVVTVA